MVGRREISADEERILSRYGLQCVRWLVIAAGFAIPIAAGVVLAGVTFWFATWWPRLFGLDGNGYFVAATLNYVRFTPESRHSHGSQKRSAYDPKRTLSAAATNGRF